ncbi:hypothetical protein L1049_000609 [Liquidambar formosana]|uniref:Uncharacterized protein n=1 Tax=Liquidambar formosana TaxID=63359 RepID=A0AAP0R4X1_LIQFO
MCLNIAPDHGVIHEGVAMKLVLKNGTSVGEESGIVGDRRGGENGSDCEWIFGILTPTSASSRKPSSELIDLRVSAPTIAILRPRRHQDSKILPKEGRLPDAKKEPVLDMYDMRMAVWKWSVACPSLNFLEYPQELAKLLQRLDLRIGG